MRVLDALGVALAELDELGVGVGVGVALVSGFGIKDVGTHKFCNVLEPLVIFLAVSPLIPGMMSSLCEPCPDVIAAGATSKMTYGLLFEFVA